MSIVKYHTSNSRKTLPLSPGNIIYVNRRPRIGSRRVRVASAFDLHDIFAESALRSCLCIQYMLCLRVRRARTSDFISCICEHALAHATFTLSTQHVYTHTHTELHIKPKIIACLFYDGSNVQQERVLNAAATPRMSRTRLAIDSRRRRRRRRVNDFTPKVQRIHQSLQNYALSPLGGGAEFARTIINKVQRTHATFILYTHNTHSPNSNVMCLRSVATSYQLTKRTQNKNRNIIKRPR